MSEDTSLARDENCPESNGAPRRRIPLPIVLAVAFGIVVASIGGCVALVPGCMIDRMGKAGGGLISGAGKALSQAFHLRTEVIHGSSVQTYESSREVREYVVLEEIVHRKKPWNATGWFWQQKGVDTEHRVRAKYGFDLDRGKIQLEENPVTGAIIVRYPEPELLSVEVLEEDWQRRDNFFNKLTDQDIKEAQEMLRTSGREELEVDQTRLAKARQIFEERMMATLLQQGIQNATFETIAPTASQLELKPLVPVTD